MKKIDFIIVGQGLAGSILALELLQQNKTVLVIDNADLSKCSQTAAGIYNPVVFKRLTQSWMAEDILPAMFSFFLEAEKKLETKILHPTKIAKVLSTENEIDLWNKKSINELADLLENKIYHTDNESNLAFLQSTYAFVKQAGFVDVPTFLNETKNYLQKQNSYLNETIDCNQLILHEDKIEYKSFLGSKIIFCEGWLIKQNKWFSTLPFKPAKGEVIIIYCEDLKINSIINKDIFILPLPQAHHFKVGATYNWLDLSDTTTPTAQIFLEDKLKSIISYSYKIVNQQAGVRPSTIDRRPVIGFHPSEKNIGVFNGFGTKSVMLAPFFAKHFCSFMFLNEPLFTNVDVKRFYA